VTRAADQPVYSIGATARMLDLAPSTLRAWEDRYGLVIPSRSEGAQRLYSRNQIEQLKFIKAQIDTGVSAADAHRLLARELSTAGSPPEMPVPTRETQPLILLVERDPYAADLAEYFLRTEGYEVNIATDAKQARLLAAERRPDLAVIDLLISGGAGFRLCSELKGSGTGEILAVASIDAGEEAIALGASAFLHKPLEPLALASAVRDLLGTSALARPSRQPAPR